MATSRMEALAATLEPYPSVSRLGKMAYNTMHTGALVRSGMQGMLSGIPKGHKTDVTKLQIVDPSQLDTFGTGEPGLDVGRNREMCSSPRGHPLLEMQMDLLAQEGKRGAFTKSLQADSTSAAEAEVKKIPVKETGLKAIDMEESKTPRRPELGSPCFRTTPRFLVRSPEAPPLGHYRPRFQVVDRTVTGPTMRIPTATTPRTPRPPAEAAAPDADKRIPTTVVTPDAGSTRGDLSRGASARAGPDGNKLAQGEEEGPTAMGSGVFTDQNQSSIIVGGDPKASPKAAPPPAAPASPGRSPQKKAKPRAGTSAFVSKTPGAGDLPRTYTGPDSRWPFNEVHTTPRASKGAFIDFSRQTTKEALDRGKSGMKAAPDVVYDLTDRNADKNKAHYDFGTQIDRDQAESTHVKQTFRYANSFVINGVLPHNCASYDLDKAEKASTRIRNHNPPNFSKTVGRDQVPAGVNSIGKTPTKDLTYDPSDEALKKNEKVLKFDGQKPREMYMQQLPMDLSYDPKFTAVEARTKGLDVQKSQGHGIFWNIPAGTQLDYNPQYNLTSPRTSGAPEFASGPEYARPPIRPPTVDTFYERDSSLTRERVKGNPMIGQHLSRNQRNDTFKTAPNSPDKFYDYKVEHTLPSPSKSNLDFVNRPQRNLHLPVEKEPEQPPSPKSK